MEREIVCIKPSTDLTYGKEYYIISFSLRNGIIYILNDFGVIIFCSDNIFCLKTEWIRKQRKEKINKIIANEM